MIRGRGLTIGATGVVLITGLFLLLLFLRPADVDAAAPAAHDYVGVASCAGTTCHGRSEATGKIVRQDELMIWQNPASLAGAHSRAWRTLTESRSKAIAARLGIGDPAASTMCLGCHATPVGRGSRGPRFQASDGVGCEGCHGAASGWLASHYAVGGTHTANVSRGLVPLDDPRARASVCLDCHFGSSDSGQFVDHRIMAAGHPRISFELDLFTTLQQHHDEDADYAQRKRRASTVQTWAVGQAMALDRSLALFAGSRGGRGLFPEFYFFDCHTCHRRISDEPNFRPSNVPNPGRPVAGDLPSYNDENMIMLSAAVRVAAPSLAARFQNDSRAFHAAIGQGRPAAVAAASRLRESASAVGNAIAGAGISRAQAFAMIRAIAGEPARFTDYEGSVQAVMAVDTLLTALVKSGWVAPASAQAIRPDVEGAYRAARDPNGFNPADFQARLGRAGAAIGRLQ